jgi:uncharacterized protein YjbI with pentapeptide repeats
MVLFQIGNRVRTRLHGAVVYCSSLIAIIALHSPPANGQSPRPPATTKSRPRQRGPQKPAAGQVPACPAASGKNYSGQNLTNTNFSTLPAGSLVGANFTNATLNGAIFANQDISNASFQGANLGPSSKGSVDFTSATLNATCFAGATMNATDFTFAQITCADFSNTSMIQAQFGPVQYILPGKGCRTKFVGSAIDVHAITTDHWAQVDFTNASFQNLTSKTFNLRGVDITGAMLSGTDFSNIDFTGANLTNVDFSGTTLSWANLSATRLNGANLSHFAKLNFANLSCAQFFTVSSSALQCGSPPVKPCPAAPVSTNPTGSANLTQAILQNATFDGATLDAATLTSANLSGASLQYATFRNATLEGSGNLNVATVQGADFTNANFQNAHLNSVQFTNVILAGACFDQKTTFSGTTFAGSIMPGATFDSATLESVSFNSAILENAVFTNATMKTNPGGGSAVDFGCSLLGGANFTNASVIAANFQAAVMPPASACCTQQGGTSWCGTIDLTQQAYGAVLYPLLQAPQNCPNGDVAICNAAQWTIPQWQTNLCNVSHVTKTVWSKPDCGGTPGTVVKFNDPNLKSCILNGLPGKPSEIQVTTAATILEVSCPGLGITDLTGLEKFTALTSLDLSANALTQFTLPLVQLQKLKLGANQLNALDLSNFSTLVSLDISHNQLKAIVGMASVAPVYMDLSYNQFTAFDLPIQSSLVFADLSHNNLTNVLDPLNKTLANLTAINYLDLSNNSLSGIGAATSIAQNGPLSSMFLECNPTFACSSLQLTSQSTALQKSGCAEFNPQTNKWVTLVNPSCPVGGANARPAAARPARKPK